MPPSETSASVAEITAHRRLEGLELTVKSASLASLFSLLSRGTSTRNTAAPARARRSGEDENDPETAYRLARGQPSREPEPSAVPQMYTGPTHRYTLPLVENGIPRQLAGFSLGRFDMWGNPELLCSRGPKLNLSFLTALGMDSSDGVSITIPTVVSDKLLTEFLEGVQSAIRQLYIDYIAERRHSITITSEHATS